jgi:hypothetical protein
MGTTCDEIAGSQFGGAQAADDCATPYSPTALSEIIGDVRLLVSQYCIRPTTNKVTKVMFVGSLIKMIEDVNDKLPFYIEDLKQSKIVEAFCISSGQFRDDDFWDLIDKICKEMRQEEVYQSLKDNRDRLQSLLAEAESAMQNCNPEVFEIFFYTKKLDYSDAGVMKRFNLYLYEHQPPSIDKLRELRAQAVAKALEMGVFDFASTPSQKEMKEVCAELNTDILPYGYEVTEAFKIAYSKFRRYTTRNGLLMTPNYVKYGRYILHYYYDFSDAQRYAIFELDMMMLLINEEMKNQKTEVEKTEQPTQKSPQENMPQIAPNNSGHMNLVVHNYYGTVNQVNSSNGQIGFSDEQVANALLACAGEGKAINSKQKWAGAYWCLRWKCNYPVDAKDFCNKIESLNLGLSEDYSCSYNNIRRFCNLSFMDCDPFGKSEVKVSNMDRGVYSWCREIALKIAEELGKTYLQTG